MSYCRWSSDNGYCDVYVYEDVSGGWTTHVAGRRRPPGAPDSGITHLLGENASVKAYRTAQARRNAWDNQNPPEVIDHSEAGASFNHETPGACADNLERLKAEGFMVPVYAIETLREEQDDMDAGIEE